MPDDRSHHERPDTAPLFRLVRSARAAIRLSRVVTGAAATIGLALAVLAVVAVLDIIVPPDPQVTVFHLLGWRWSIPDSAFRLVGLLLIVVPALWTFGIGVAWPLLRRWPLPVLARRIETQIPGMHNRLVSCIDLADGDMARKSPAFYHRLIDEARERVHGFRLRSLIDLSRLRRAVLCAFAGMCAFGILWVVFFDRLPTALARIASPFADIPPAAAVAYEVAPGSTKILRGENVAFRVEVLHGEPENLSLELSADRKAEPLRYELHKVSANVWGFTLTGALPKDFAERFQYRVFGGGTWSKEFTIEQVDRPRIAAIRTIVHYPQYLGSQEVPGTPLKLDAVGPEGSQMEVVVEVEDNKSTVIHGEIQHLEHRRGRIETANRAERVWFDDRLPPGARAEGWQWDADKLDRTTHADLPGANRHSFQETPTGFPVQRGESLFAYVYLAPENPPQTIALQWHDGQGWGQTACWGAARSGMEKLVGPLPAAGQWVRLEVSAGVLGLEGKILRGMSFARFGGACYWHRAGALAPRVVEQDRLDVVRTFPLQQHGPRTWSGQFPLIGQGAYRIELRDDLGHANPTMKEGKFAALPDRPPQVLLERPGADLVLSKPARVPLVILASDDFGLSEIAVVVQPSPGASFERKVVKRSGPSVRHESVVAHLDLTRLKVKTNAVVRYHVEAVDRKGQLARTPDFTVQIAPGSTAEDRKLAAMEKRQEAFHARLVKLIAEQEKVRAGVAELDAAVAPALEDIRRRLAPLVTVEQRQTDVARQLQGELAWTAEEAMQLKMVPRELAAEMQRFRQAFQVSATQPLSELADRLARGADPMQAPPNVPAMHRRTERVQRDLEGLRKMHAALLRAQKRLHDESDGALTDLHRDLRRLRADLTARELHDLHDYVNDLRKDLATLHDRQEGLHRETHAAADSELDKADGKQKEVDRAADPLLGQTRKLQGGATVRRLKKEPPESNTDPRKATEDEHRFMPALGGATPQPKQPKPRPTEGPPRGKRGQLEDRQEQRLNDLEQANRSLASDQNTLSELSKQLATALKGAEEKPQNDAPLSKLMQSPTVRQALAMARCMEEMKNARGQSSQGQSGSSSTGSLSGGSRAGVAEDADLSRLDLPTRTMLLKLQPRLREELLQGMREEGPEGYQKFIQEYFKRLTQQPK